MTNIKSSREHIEHKLFIFIILFPIFVFAFLASVNDIFGFDMTGGLLGERQPVTVGGAVVFGAPIFLFYFVKTLRDFFGEAPIHMKISKERVDILLPNFITLKWTDISSTTFKTIRSERVLVFKKSDKIVVKLKMKFLDTTEEELSNLLEKYKLL